MSHRPINRSADLTRLREDGYDIDVLEGGLLLVSDVPYVTSERIVKRGRFICKLSLADDITQEPDDHTIHFEGEYPCNADGSPIEAFRHSSPNAQLAPGVVGNHLLSAKPKPKGQYDNYEHKIAVYVGFVSGPAQRMDPTATAKTHPIILPEEEDDSVFNYLDNATGRAELNVISNKLALQRLAIVGLGGTGSYVLDLVAKTRVRELHLFDGDTFLQHNAFRAPGAASGDELRAKPSKVAYYQAIYSKMRKGIVAHSEFVDSGNVDQLREMDFVFLCMDSGVGKRQVVRKLEQFGTPFVDVGMGLYEADGALAGLLKVTTSTSDQRAHVWDKQRIRFNDDDDENEYDRNIQIADLNALNATLAVIKWKKLFKFYHDMEGEFFAGYSVSGNNIVNEDQL